MENSHWSYYIQDLYTAIIHWYFRIYKHCFIEQTGYIYWILYWNFYLEFYLEFYLDLFAVYSIVLLTNDRIKIHMINMNF